jgi:hypothetical protein
MAAAQTAVICRCDRGLLGRSQVAQLEPARQYPPRRLERGNGLGGLAEHRVGHRRHHHHRRRGKLRDGRGRLVSIFLELRSSSSFSPICTQAVCAEAVPRLTLDARGFSYGSLSGRAAWNRASGTFPPFFLLLLEQTGSQTPSVLLSFPSRLLHFRLSRG